jgi:hypothetical protein
MKYKTPELNVLTPAINAIQTPKNVPPDIDHEQPEEQPVSAYEDWE